MLLVTRIKPAFFFPERDYNIQEEGIDKEWRTFQSVHGLEDWRFRALTCSPSSLQSLALVTEEDEYLIEILPVEWVCQTMFLSTAAHRAFFALKGTQRFA